LKFCDCYFILFTSRCQRYFSNIPSNVRKGTLFVNMRLLWTGTFGCHGTGGCLRSRGYNAKINMEGEINMLLSTIYFSLVSVLRVQVLFLNRYALLLRRRRALYSVCLNDGLKYGLNHTWSGVSG